MADVPTQTVSRLPCWLLQFKEKSQGISIFTKYLIRSECHFVTEFHDSVILFFPTGYKINVQMLD